MISAARAVLGAFLCVCVVLAHSAAAEGVHDANVPGDLGISEEDVAIFHISLWSSIFVIATTCWAGCALTYMDTGDDSIFNIDISNGVKKAN